MSTEILNISDKELCGNEEESSTLYITSSGRYSDRILMVIDSENSRTFLLNGESARKLAITLLNWAGSNTASLGEELGEALAQELTRHDTRIHKIETFLKSFGGSNNE
jgi:hypothetical protein